MNSKVKEAVGLSGEQVHEAEQEAFVNSQIGDVENGPDQDPYGEEEETVDQEEEVNPVLKIYEAIQEFDSPPTLRELEEWKDINGVFYASIISSGTMFLWKTLKRGVMKSIIDSGAAKDEATYQNAVVRRCLLWPTPQPGFFRDSDAGIVPTLYRQISYQSGFIPEEMTLSLIDTI